MNNKFLQLLRFRTYIREAKVITTPLDLLEIPKYVGYEKARIMKKDHERTPVIDFLLAHLYRTYILLDSNSWVDAFIAIYNGLCVINYFNEFVIYIRCSFLLVLIL